ncbi:hypothetical protein ACQPZJ_44815 [Actinoplanes sp. CA-054009]
MLISLGSVEASRRPV